VIDSIALQVGAAFALFLVALLIEAGATVGVLEWRRHHMSALRDRYSAVRGIVHVCSIVLFLLAVHFLHMLLWAGAYYAGGAFDSFYRALFFSMSCYSTLGFASYLPPPGWELFASFEGVAGSLLMGWSAGILFAAAHGFYRSLLATRASLEPGLD
jgi:hypothetical protein